MSKTEKKIIALSASPNVSLENTNILIIFKAKKQKNLYFIKIIRSINSRPETKIYDGSQTQTKSQA